MIVEAPSLKDGSGKELRRLHDVVQQHIHALKSLGHDPPGPFITSLIELRLDATTMFEWQRHSQGSADVPHYDDILKFLNLCAQASESAAQESSRGSSQQSRKCHSGKQVGLFADVEVPIYSSCVVCKEKHPLYACAKFKELDHENMLPTVRSNRLCINCLYPGHLSKDCRSTHRCKRCQKPHHTLLHVDHKKDAPQQGAGATSVSTHSPVCFVAHDV